MLVQVGDGLWYVSIIFLLPCLKITNKIVPTPAPLWIPCSLLYFIGSKGTFFFMKRPRVEREIFLLFWCFSLFWMVCYILLYQVWYWSSMWIDNCLVGGIKHFNVSITLIRVGRKEIGQRFSLRFLLFFFVNWDDIGSFPFFRENPFSLTIFEDQFERKD